MKTLKGYFSAFVKHPPEDIKNPPPPFLMQWVYKFTLCDIIHSWACASEDTAIPVVPKDRRTLRETYVHLTPLSHVWHFSNITVMTEPLWGLAPKATAQKWQEGQTPELCFPLLFVELQLWHNLKQLHCATTGLDYCGYIESIVVVTLWTYSSFFSVF